MFPCAAVKETGGTKLHRVSDEVGVVDVVEVIHLTAPYCAVNPVAVNGTMPLKKVPKEKDTVGNDVKPVVAHVVESVCVNVPPPAQKFPVTVGLIVLAFERY